MVPPMRDFSDLPSTADATGCLVVLALLALLGAMAAFAVLR